MLDNLPDITTQFSKQMLEQVTVMRVEQMKIFVADKIKEAKLKELEASMLDLQNKNTELEEKIKQQGDLDSKIQLYTTQLESAKQINELIRKSGFLKQKEFQDFQSDENITPLKANVTKLLKKLENLKEEYEDLEQQKSLLQEGGKNRSEKLAADAQNARDLTKKIVTYMESQLNKLFQDLQITATITMDKDSEVGWRNAQPFTDIKNAFEAERNKLLKSLQKQKETLKSLRKAQGDKANELLEKEKISTDLNIKLQGKEKELETLKAQYDALTKQHETLKGGITQVTEDEKKQLKKLKKQIERLAEEKGELLKNQEAKEGILNQYKLSLSNTEAMLKKANENQQTLTNQVNQLLQTVQQNKVALAQAQQNQIEQKFQEGYQQVQTETLKNLAIHQNKLIQQYQDEHLKNNHAIIAFQQNMLAIQNSWQPQQATGIKVSAQDLVNLLEELSQQLVKLRTVGDKYQTEIRAAEDVLTQANEEQRSSTNGQIVAQRYNSARQRLEEIMYTTIS